MSKAVLVGGEPVYCDAEVKTWHETGLFFPALRMRSEHRAICCHWTGGEQGGPGLFRTLTDRRLSVHFGVDQSGVVWQYCDANAYCAHAGAGGDPAIYSANGWAVGIEIVNRADQDPSHAPWRRDLVDDVIHGHAVQYTDFTALQVRSALALIDALSRAYGIPATPPTGPDGKVLDRLMTHAELSTYRGVLGHFHNNPGKQDPGTRLLAKLLEVPHAT